MVSGGDNTLSRTGCTYSSTQKSDGTYSIYSNLENSNAVIDPTNINIYNTGTWFGDIYPTRTADTNIFTVTGNSATITGAFRYSTNYYLRIVHGASSKDGTDTSPGSTWVRAGFSWDSSGGAGAGKIAVKLGANAWQESTGLTLTQNSSITTLYIVGGSWQWFIGYIDNVKIYSDYKHTET